MKGSYFCLKELLQCVCVCLQIVKWSFSGLFAIKACQPRLGGVSLTWHFQNLISAPCSLADCGQELLERRHLAKSPVRKVWGEEMLVSPNVAAWCSVLPVEYICPCREEQHEHPIHCRCIFLFSFKNHIWIRLTNVCCPTFQVSFGSLWLGAFPQVCHAVHWTSTYMEDSNHEFSWMMHHVAKPIKPSRSTATAL